MQQESNDLRTRIDNLKSSEQRRDAEAVTATSSNDSVLCNQNRKDLFDNDKEYCTNSKINDTLKDKDVWPTIVSGKVATDMVYKLKNETSFIDSKKMIALDPNYKAKLLAHSFSDKMKAPAAVRWAASTEDARVIAEGARARAARVAVNLWHNGRRPATLPDEQRAAAEAVAKEEDFNIPFKTGDAKEFSLSGGQLGSYDNILRTMKYVVHEMYNASQDYVAFSKPYNKISFPLLADHQALCGTVQLSGGLQNPVKIMVVSAAEANSGTKGWISDEAENLLKVLGGLNKLTTFSNDIGKPFTDKWLELCNQWIKGNPTSNAFKKTLQDFKEGNAALLKQLFKEDSDYTPADNAVADTKLEGNLFRLYKNAIHQYEKIIDSLDRERYDEPQKNALKEKAVYNEGNNLNNGGIVLEYTKWKENLKSTPGDLFDRGVIERGFDENKVSQASILDGQPTGGWIFGDGAAVDEGEGDGAGEGEEADKKRNFLARAATRAAAVMSRKGTATAAAAAAAAAAEASVYTNLQNMKNMYSDALLSNKADIMIINENFDIKDEEPLDGGKGKGKTKLQKITKKCGVILKDGADIECSDYNGINNKINNVSGKITFIRVNRHGAEDFLILNWHGGSKSATLKEMKTLFDFCDEYNKRNDPPTPNLKIQVICGDSNITKSKQLITVKEAIISCKPEAIIRGGENYSDKRISKFRWGGKCEKDILLNNQWNKAGPNPPNDDCAVEAEEDGMFLVGDLVQLGIIQNAVKDKTDAEKSMVGAKAAAATAKEKEAEAKEKAAEAAAAAVAAATAAEKQAVAASADLAAVVAERKKVLQQAHAREATLQKERVVNAKKKNLLMERTYYKIMKNMGEGRLEERMKEEDDDEVWSEILEKLAEEVGTKHTDEGKGQNSISSADTLDQMKSIIHWCSTVKYNYSLSSNNIYNDLETLKMLCYAYTENFFDPSSQDEAAVARWNARADGIFTTEGIQSKNIYISLEEYTTFLLNNGKENSVPESFRFGYKNYNENNEKTEFGKLKKIITDTAQEAAAPEAREAAAATVAKEAAVKEAAVKEAAAAAAAAAPAAARVARTKAAAAAEAARAAAADTSISIVIYSDILSNISNENFLLKKDFTSNIISKKAVELLKEFTNMVGDGTVYIISSKYKQVNPDWKSKLIEILEVDHCVFADDKDWSIHINNNNPINNFGSIPKNMCDTVMSHGNKAGLLEIYMDTVLEDLAPKFNEKMEVLYNYYFINYISTLWCNNKSEISIVKNLNRLSDLAAEAAAGAAKDSAAREVAAEAREVAAEREAMGEAAWRAKYPKKAAAEDAKTAKAAEDAKTKMAADNKAAKATAKAADDNAVAEKKKEKLAAALLATTEEKRRQAEEKYKKLVQKHSTERATDKLGVFSHTWAAKDAELAAAKKEYDAAHAVHRRAVSGRLDAALRAAAAEKASPAATKAKAKANIAKAAKAEESRREVAAKAAKAAKAKAAADDKAAKAAAKRKLAKAHAEAKADVDRRLKNPVVRAAKAAEEAEAKYNSLEEQQKEAAAAYARGDISPVEKRHRDQKLNKKLEDAAAKVAAANTALEAAKAEESRREADRGLEGVQRQVAAKAAKAAKAKAAANAKAAKAAAAAVVRAEKAKNDADAKYNSLEEQQKEAAAAYARGDISPVEKRHRDQKLNKKLEKAAAEKLAADTALEAANTALEAAKAEEEAARAAEVDDGASAVTPISAPAVLRAFLTPPRTSESESE